MMRNTHYSGKDRLVILDADGTTIDAFAAIGKTFRRHGMDIGDLERFQKRRNLFKYIGGIKEFPANLRRQLGKGSRAQLIQTLTEVYREEGGLYEGVRELIQQLIARDDIRVGVVTRNITLEPLETLARLFHRHDIEASAFDFFIHLPLGEKKTAQFLSLRDRFRLNPALTYACGDEHKDYLAAITAGMYPFMVSYGFESHCRLLEKCEIPEAHISRTPAELIYRMAHTLGLRED